MINSQIICVSQYNFYFPLWDVGISPNANVLQLKYINSVGKCLYSLILMLYLFE